MTGVQTCALPILVTYEGNGLPSTTGLINNATHRFAMNGFYAYGGNALFKSTQFTRSPIYGSDYMPDFETKIPTSVKPYLNSFAVTLQHIVKRFS